MVDDVDALEHSPVVAMTAATPAAPADRQPRVRPSKTSLGATSSSASPDEPVDDSRDAHAASAAAAAGEPHKLPAIAAAGGTTGGGGAAAAAKPVRSSIDPLSQTILKRTSTDRTTPARVRRQASVDLDSAVQETIPETPPEKTKEKKKGVSFFSRIIGGSRRKEPPADWDDASDVGGETRVSGTEAELFGQPVGFVPKYLPPPKYIKVRTHYKKDKLFDKLFIAQDLGPRVIAPTSSIPDHSSDDAPPPAETGTAIWALEFSQDGRFLAAAGQDCRVRVWAVIASREDRQAHEIEEDARSDQLPIRLNAPVFRTQPVRTYEGHTGSVVDLSWSKNDFLLSTSMDKTVRLWHVTRNECLCCFQHSDFVTSIQFHPRDDRFFLAGSLDARLRLWSIPDKSVAFSSIMPDMITAVAFTPDGAHAIAGCLNGLCMIFDTDGLRLHSQLHVRSARGRNSKGSKITGIDTAIQPPGSTASGALKLLITSNDSRIRLYNFRYRTLEAKFRGNENHSSQIRATFSSDGRFIICGSEDHRVYIWPLRPLDSRDPDKRPVEVFEPHPSAVTSAIFAPVRTKQILGSTGDIVYDLCNPLTSSHAKAESTHGTSSPPAAAANVTSSANHTVVPSDATHPDGNIIVTVDLNGSIKVFRQDCGYNKRPPELWNGHSHFSRRLLGRANSVSTRRSRHSVASSSHDLGRDPAARQTPTPSDRILSWRNAVNSAGASVENVLSSAFSVGAHSHASLSSASPPSSSYQTTDGRSPSKRSSIATRRPSESSPKFNTFPVAVRAASSPLSKSLRRFHKQQEQQHQEEQGKDHKPAKSGAPGAGFKHSLDSSSIETVFSSPETHGEAQKTHTASQREHGAPGSGHEPAARSHPSPLDTRNSSVSSNKPVVTVTAPTPNPLFSPNRNLDAAYTLPSNGDAHPAIGLADADDVDPNITRALRGSLFWDKSAFASQAQQGLRPTVTKTMTQLSSRSHPSSVSTLSSEHSSDDFEDAHSRADDEEGGPSAGLGLGDLRGDGQGNGYGYGYAKANTADSDDEEACIICGETRFRATRSHGARRLICVNCGTAAS